MRNKKILITTIGIVVVGVITALVSIRISMLNSIFPNPTLIQHQLNENILLNETSFTALDCQLISGTQLKQMLPDYIDEVENKDGSKVRDEQIRVILVRAKLKNTTSITQTIELVQMYAASLVWSNGIDGDLFPRLNSDVKNPMLITLEPNQEIEVIIPYTMYDFQFSQEVWDNMQYTNFDLVLTFYPDKHFIKLL